MAMSVLEKSHKATPFVRKGTIFQALAEPVGSHGASWIAKSEHRGEVLLALQGPAG